MATRGQALSSQMQKALRNKAKQANAPYSALAAIARKGMGAAMSSGRRPGVSPEQWGLARANSVIAGGKARKVDRKQWEAIQAYRKRRRS